MSLIPVELPDPPTELGGVAVFTQGTGWVSITGSRRS